MSQKPYKVYIFIPFLKDETGWNYFIQRCQLIYKNDPDGTLIQATTTKPGTSPLSCIVVKNHLCIRLDGSLDNHQIHLAV